MQLDKVVIDRLSRPIKKCWDQIGPDCLEFIEDTDNISAVEMTIDANRLKYNANDEQADKLVTSLCVEHSYLKVLTFLSDNIRLL